MCALSDGLTLVHPPLRKLRSRFSSAFSMALPIADIVEHIVVIMWMEIQAICSQPASHISEPLKSDVQTKLLRTLDEVVKLDDEKPNLLERISRKMQDFVR